MNYSALKEIIARCAADLQFRHAVYTQPTVALSGYQLSQSEQHALQRMANWSLTERISANLLMAFDDNWSK